MIYIYYNGLMSFNILSDDASKFASIAKDKDINMNNA